MKNLNIAQVVYIASALIVVECVFIERYLFNL